MSENSNSNHNTENKEEIILKTLFDFPFDKSDNTYSQTQPINNKFNMASCFANV